MIVLDKILHIFIETKFKPQYKKKEKISLQVFIKKIAMTLFLMIDVLSKMIFQTKLLKLLLNGIVSAALCKEIKQCLDIILVRTYRNRIDSALLQCRVELVALVSPPFALSVLHLWR